MKIRLASIAIVIAMSLSLGGNSVFAKPLSDPKSPADETKTSSNSAPSAKSETARNDKLKADMLKLVADTKAGKVAPRGGTQIPRNQRNNLSTGAKIGIAAAIGGLIFLAIVLHKLNSD